MCLKHVPRYRILAAWRLTRSFDCTQSVVVVSKARCNALPEVSWISLHTLQENMEIPLTEKIGKSE